MDSTSSKLIKAFCLTFLIGITAIVYYPGLSGPFLFDDFSNLERLGDLGGIHDWKTLKAFLLSGTAGPTGRPVSLFSFVLNAQNWPANPYWFKFTNLIIHLANGMLIFLISRRLLRFTSYAKSPRPQEFWIALFATGAWLLHPFFVSTTLYVVQRMAQLSAFFSLLGVAWYIHGRRLSNIDKRRGYLSMTLSLVLCGSLAILSKENGALLPVLILALEITIFSSNNQVTKLAPWWRNIFLVFPSVLIFLYLCSRLQSPFIVNIERGFSTYERLLTESRVLVDYLRGLFIPEYFATGVFHDDYNKSVSVFNPLSTAYSILFNILVVTLALIWRKKYALFSFAILFFYFGHLIESTTISIELYFEHRNYLPAAFLFLPLVYCVFEKLDYRKAFVICAVFIGIFSTITRHSAGLWSSYDNLVLGWAAKSPDSARAQQQASMTLYNQGQSIDALNMVNTYLTRNPKDFSMWIWNTILECRAGRQYQLSLKRVENLAVSSMYDKRELGLFRLFTDLPLNIHDRCQLSTHEVDQILMALTSSPMNSDHQTEAYAQLQYLRGISALNRNDVTSALNYFRNSLNSYGTPDSAMNMASEFARYKFFNEAILMSDEAIKYILSGEYGQTRQSADSWKNNIQMFQNEIKKEIDKTELNNQEMQ